MRVLRCPRLPQFDPVDLASSRRAFAAAPAATLTQAWLATPHPAFRPGAARAAWRPGELLVFAELEDDDVFTRAVGAGQRFWELGDVFELFLETTSPTFYVELHVAPGNRRAQLRIPIPRPPGSPESLMTPPAFDSRVWEEPGRWSALAVVPFATIGGKPARFSFSRYDYTRGRAEAVLSSTSPHQRLDFHLRDDWGMLELA